MKINKRSLITITTLAFVLGMSFAPANLQAYRGNYNRGGFLSSFRSAYVFIVARFVAPNPPCNCG